MITDWLKQVNKKDLISLEYGFEKNDSWLKEILLLDLSTKKT